MFRTILVGFDGSARGEDALELGGLLARLTGARLLVACVYEMPALSGPHDELSQVLARDAERIAAQAVRMSREPVAEAVTVQEPAPARGLERAAQEHGADLVVVGSSHRGALGRLLIGSVPECLMHDAATAVAIAPAGYVTGEEPRAERIGIGFDGGPESTAALEVAAQLARAADATLHVIGVIGTRLGALIPTPMAGIPHATYLQAIEERERLSVQEAAASLTDVDVDAVAEPRLGGPVTLLRSRTGQLDLLVLGSHAYGALRRTLHGSVSTALARDAACPLVVLPRVTP
ncbi:MAG TPA: universal stress protein [Conexibacter sp.]|nr:universal stress protein [Conexibacter sp.]